jgi:LPXTG-site transpeptidase (sortase) family protein
MNLKKINNLLLVLIILVNLYVILLPFLPALLFAVQKHGGREQVLTQKVQAPLPKPTAAHPVVTSQPNGITIPSMLLDQPILEGRDTYAVLNHGILRWPAGSTPDKGGNTVLVGHRFTYTLPKGVFYYLNKVSVGDELSVVWNNQKYIYKVSQIEVVPPTDTAIEDPTTDARLTLFTCTPLLWPTQRLVVIAELEVSVP